MLVMLAACCLPARDTRKSGPCSVAVLTSEEHGTAGSFSRVSLQSAMPAAATETPNSCIACAIADNEIVAVPTASTGPLASSALAERTSSDTMNMQHLATSENVDNIAREDTHITMTNRESLTFSFRGADNDEVNRESDADTDEHSDASSRIMSDFDSYVSDTAYAPDRVSDPSCTTRNADRRQHTTRLTKFWTDHAKSLFRRHKSDKLVKHRPAKKVVPIVAEVGPPHTAGSEVAAEGQARLTITPYYYLPS
ncbi:uncharacterized protein V1518DRAFT_408869 [Limtongia smithiae]|uniref:uncharacterized protein n=1 Tax=Limtongia smithiae TaxID=1125753 RepID=UPI0034CD94AB